MQQYNKLFDSAEIEYITPFLKLWMAFNNWYKQDLRDFPNVRTDQDAINEYKKQGYIKKEFLRLLNGRSNEDENFQIVLAEFVKKILELKQEKLEYPNDLFIIHPSNDTVKNNALVFISSQITGFYYTDGDDERFFEETLDIIYKIRCKLVHGDFDIGEASFIDLVEKSYFILHPIMDRILQHQADGEFFCKSKEKNVEATGIFNEGEMTVLAGSKVAIKVVASYNENALNDRIKKLSEQARKEADHYILTENIKFDSPSRASSFCLGFASNGWDDWKTKSGKSLNDVIRDKED